MPDYRVLPATWEEYEKRHGDPRERLGEEDKAWRGMRTAARWKAKEEREVNGSATSISDQGIGAAS